MRKFNISIGVLLVGGMLLAGCSEREDDPREVQTAEEIQLQGMEEVEEIVEEETRLDSLKKRTVEYTEYSSLEGFVKDTANNWKEGSDYRKVNYSTEDSLASATIVYINFFEDEITELGMNADFDELQLLADDVVQSRETPEQEEHAKKFEDKLHDILLEMKRVASYETIEEWVTASDKILSEPLDNPTLSVANDDEGLEYTLKAQKVMDAFPSHLLGTGDEVEEIHSKVFLLTSEIAHLQYVRTVQWNGEDQVEELPIDEWANVDDDMRRAFDELKQVIHDVAG
jgi:hypothetical protein